MSTGWRRMVVLYCSLINYRVLICFILFSLLTILPAQNLLNFPESVEWDHINQTWLVSNYGSGEIIRYLNQTDQEIFSADLSSSRGLKIKDDKLYVAAGEGVAVYDLATALLEHIVVITEAVLLNDLEFDDSGYLFVSDYWGNKIFRIDCDDYTYELFVDYGILAPNGLIFEAANERIICCGHNGVATRIFAFNVNTAETEILWIPTIHSLDGWAVDQAGDLYVSSWHTDAIYKFNGFSISPDYEMVVAGVEDPADIFINPENNILAIPLFSADSVYFHQIEPVSAGNDLVAEVGLRMSVLSRPGLRQVEFRISLARAGHTQLTLYNVKGQKIATLLDEFKPAGNIAVIWDRGNLASGIYFNALQSGKYNVGSKMLLIK